LLLLSVLLLSVGTAEQATTSLLGARSKTAAQGEAGCGRRLGRRTGSEKTAASCGFVLSCAEAASAAKQAARRLGLRLLLLLLLRLAEQTCTSCASLSEWISWRGRLLGSRGSTKA
jgi:hypothetical protein